METQLKQIKSIGEAITVVRSILYILDWDQNTQMPTLGTDHRGFQNSYLQKHLHQQLTGTGLGEALAELKAHPEFDSLSDWTKANVRLIEDEYERHAKVPESLVAAVTETGTKSFQVWVEARKNNDFASFAKVLSEMIRLKQEVARCLTSSDDLYQPLFEEYEPGFDAAGLPALFETLKSELKELIDNNPVPPVKNADQILKTLCDKEKLFEVGLKLIDQMGFDRNRGRIDWAPHPFCIGNGAGTDVRLTTRFDPESPLELVFALIHEAGHGMYEQNLPVETQLNQPTSWAASFGLHESQSRFYENVLSRSVAFWEWATPVFRDVFGDSFKDVSSQDMALLVNQTKPGLIRVSADEVTYNLHIAIRFQIERDLMLGKIQVNDLPEVWNNAYTDLLGVTPDSDANGVLQDVHWSMGLMGYFPTYALGNLYSAQLLEKLKQDQPSWDDDVAKGDFAPTLNWLRDNVHQKGSLVYAKDLVKDLTGKELSADAFVGYLKAKRSQLS